MRPLWPCIALLLFAPHVAAQTKRPGDLHFSTRSVISLPPGFTTSDMTIDSTAHRLAVVSADRASLLVVDSSGNLLFSANGFENALAARFRSDGLVEVLDAGARQVVRLDSGGARTDSIGFELSRPTVAATHFRGTWWSFVTAGDTLVATDLLSGGSEHRFIFNAAVPKLAGLSALAQNNMIVVSLRTSPFTSIVFDPSHPATHHWITPTFTRARDGEAWVGLQLLFTHDQWIQTIANQRTDQRMLVKYDLAGQVYDCKSINAPIAFISTSGGDVYAARNISLFEIVRYRVHAQERSEKSNENAC